MPVLTVVAGPNGSGKSTFIGVLAREGVTLGDYFNADDIARDLIGPPEWVSRQAQQIVRDRRETALQAGQDHAFETVMSHPSHIDYMGRAATAGFEVRLYFIATESPELNLDRVANRVLHGGHDVPADRIIDRYHRCLDQLPAAIRNADFCFIYDNSSAIEPFLPLAEVRKERNLSWLAHSPRSFLTLHEPLDPERMRLWWVNMLLSIKPDDPFSDGFLA